MSGYRLDPLAVGVDANRFACGAVSAGQSGPVEGVVSRLTMIYWKGKKFWLGKLKEHPEIMTQGRTLKELEANLRDAYRMMFLEDVPEEYREKAIAV